MALEDGDLTSVKEAITNKKDDLNSEIRDTIEPEITVTDTPIDPTLSRRVMKDLGEVVLEKEILNDAEKVVDEKLGVSEESMEGSVGGSNRDSNKDEDSSKGEESLEEPKDIPKKTSTSNSLTKTKSTPSKKTKVVNKTETPKKDTSSSTSFISRTPRRAASQTTVEDPLMTPIPKRTKRNSTAPKSEKPKKK
uniref:Uncharacterized protein n=1 Tax=Nosema pernyi TaxID=1112939 RepID=X5E4L0_9MICR|nr:hypothetical protein NP_02A05 [Nosema pernyi]